MKIQLSYKTLELMFKSKTLIKIFSKVIEGYNKAIEINPQAEGIEISMSDLSKSLGYKNKSTVSRGLKELSMLGLFDLTTSNKGTIIEFTGERVRQIQ